MKFLISSVFLLFLFSANASEISITSLTPNQTVLHQYPGPGKGNKRKNKRINKKRKRKCHKWARKSFAG